MKHDFKVGDIVRVSKKEANKVWAYGLKFGRLQKLESVVGYSQTAFITDQGWHFTTAQFKLAKQAMKKRDQYEARRG